MRGAVHGTVSTVVRYVLGSVVLSVVFRPPQG